MCVSAPVTSRPEYSVVGGGRSAVRGRIGIVASVSGTRVRTDSAYLQTLAQSVANDQCARMCLRYAGHTADNC
jgi:hypothetical protein